MLSARGRRNSVAQGPPGLVRFAARAALERVAPGWDGARLRDAFEHQLGAGFIEPAAGLYQVDFGGYAEMYMGRQPVRRPVRTAAAAGAIKVTWGGTNCTIRWGCLAYCSK